MVLISEILFKTFFQFEAVGLLNALIALGNSESRSLGDRSCVGDSVSAHLAGSEAAHSD